MNQSDGWRDCAPGELQGMVVMVAMGSYFLGSRWAGSSGRLSCSDVVQMHKAFEADQLEPELKARIEEHLANCDHCREMYEQTRGAILRPDGDSIARNFAHLPASRR